MTTRQIRAKNHGARQITINYGDEKDTAFMVELWDGESISNTIHAATLQEAERVAFDWINSEIKKFNEMQQ